MLTQDSSWPDKNPSESLSSPRTWSLTAPPPPEMQPLLNPEKNPNPASRKYLLENGAGLPELPHLCWPGSPLTPPSPAPAVLQALSPHSIPGLLPSTSTVTGNSEWQVLVPGPCAS